MLQTRAFSSGLYRAEPIAALNLGVSTSKKFIQYTKWVQILALPEGVGTIISTWNSKQKFGYFFTTLSYEKDYVFSGSYFLL